MEHDCNFFQVSIKVFLPLHNCLRGAQLVKKIESLWSDPRMLDLVPASACLGQYLCFNVVKSSRNHMFIELKFIEYFIFWAKKQFLATFQKLA